MKLKRWAIGGGLATLAVASVLTAGTVFAQGTPTTTNNAQSAVQTFIDRLAQNLGIPSATLQSALRKTQDQSIADAQSAGKITQQQANALKQKVDSGQVGPFLFRVGPMGGPRGGMMGPDASTIASTLGITTTQLQTELSGGKTLSAIITEHGKTVADVVNALVAQAKTQMDAQVTAGKLAADQETINLNNLTQQLTNAITNNSFGPGRGHFRGPGGPMGGWNHMNNGTKPAGPSA
ncbi:MAG TPA: hypothetical protein VMU89_10725 [Thermomicrobiaceae bacterium]|nr:hypothetical protein [Thermomicrobiaceae bacterium]